MTGEDKPLLMVLDDDAAVRQTWTLIFRQQGYRVIAVESGQDAIDAARSRPPDLLLADIRLPDMSGIEAARRIQNELPSCRVLLISGDGESSEVLEQARLAGTSFEVLPKPIAPPELIQRIADRLKR